LTTDDLCCTPAVDLAGMTRDRRLSSVELVDAVLARIEAVNPHLNADCTIAAAAFETIRPWAQRRPPLD
jgi:Asp-tRNA(Asn)/Glu-tRNA(Gln) amidotransferase A subunit family amidase